MQVRSLPSLILPQLPRSTPQRIVSPVAAQDERSQPSVNIPINRNGQFKSTDSELMAMNSQRYSDVRLDVDDSKTSRALQTYFNIETQDDQERSQLLFGVDIHA